MSNSSDSSDSTVPMVPGVSGLVPFDNWLFVQLSITSTLVSFVGFVAITLSSRHLYTNARIAKMPWIAALVWFFSTLFLCLVSVYGGRFPLAFTFALLGWICDIVARSLVLWFTFHRLMAIWPRPHRQPVLYLTVAMQCVMGAAFGYALYATLPGGPVAFYSTVYNRAVSIYAASDLMAAGLDLLLIARMYILNRSLSRTSIGQRLALVKPQFFYLSIVTLFGMIALSVTMVSVMATGRDTYWVYNSTLFAFRIMLTDVFSNLMRDSLIDQSAMGDEDDASTGMSLGNRVGPAKTVAVKTVAATASLGASGGGANGAFGSNTDILAANTLAGTSTSAF